MFVVASILLIFGLFFLFIPKDNLTAASASLGAAQVATSSLPVLLEIPRINLSANIEEVGQTSQGSMDTPKYSADVGWYKYGVTPGGKGSAVIDGHLDNFLGLKAVFYNLNKLSVGDDVYVTNQKGEKLDFVVTSKKLYDYNATDTSAVFTSTDDLVHLNLITCNGTWLKDVHNYDKRLVIFTKLVS